MQVLLPGPWCCFLPSLGWTSELLLHHGGGALGGCECELHIAIPWWLQLCSVTSDPGLCTPHQELSHRSMPCPLSHEDKYRVVKTASECCSLVFSHYFCPGPSFLSAGRSSGADKEAEHVTKRARKHEGMRQRYHSALVGPLHSKWNGVCNLWLVWCADAWQLGGVDSFLSKSFSWGLPIPHTGSPRFTISLVSIACGGMWMFWLIGLAL